MTRPRPQLDTAGVSPSRWRLPPRAIAVRLFLTCWLVYALHFATNIVREIYPALSLGDHFSFRVDEYANMHPDLFEKEGYGWHIGNNPGASEYNRLANGALKYAQVIQGQASKLKLGVSLDDPRGLTVTGGLPFFGGPGNNYSMHAIATLADRLPNSGGLGYIGANGGYLSKHSMGVYGTSPPPRGFLVADTRDAQARIDAAALPIAISAQGPAEVVASTVAYARDGSVARVPVIATLEDGRRVAADADESIRPSLAGVSLVGARIRISGSPPTYRVEAR